MRIVCAIVLALATVGTAAGQVIQAAPPIKPGSATNAPNIARAGTLNTPSITTQLEANAKALMDQISALQQQIESLLQTRNNLIMQADAVAKSKPANPDDTAWKVQQANQLKALQVQIESIDKEVDARKMKISSLLAQLDKLEQALEAEQARNKKEMDRLKAKQQAARRLDQLENFQLQQASSDYNKAASLTSAIRKKISDTSQAITQNIK
jgi:hypothetical protein